MLVKEFAEKNKHHLQVKKCGFFICCMDNDQKSKQYMKESFPESLLSKAFAIGYFGGEFNFDKMDSMEKMMIQKIAGIKENVSEIKYDNIAQFINLANCHKANAPLTDAKTEPQNNLSEHKSR